MLVSDTDLVASSLAADKCVGIFGTVCRLESAADFEFEVLISVNAWSSPKIFSWMRKR